LPAIGTEPGSASDSIAPGRRPRSSGTLPYPRIAPHPAGGGALRARWNYLAPLDKISAGLKYLDYRGCELLPFVRLLASGAELNQDADKPASGSL